MVDGTIVYESADREQGSRVESRLLHPPAGEDETETTHEGHVLRNSLILCKYCANFKLP